VFGYALHALLVDVDLCTCLSLHEVDFLREYNASVMNFRGDFLAELDVAVSITHPPWDVHLLVRIVCNCGVIKMELGKVAGIWADARLDVWDALE
jgi:GINS complex subunit 1